MQSGGVQRQGAQIGNVRVRRGRRRSQVIEVRQPRIARPRRSGVVMLMLGFLVLIAIGTALLALPFASREAGSAGFTTALFTATSAVCVTGLVVVDTRDHWTPFGQVVILLLFQLGGLGFMTSATLLLMVFGRRLSVSQHQVAGQASGNLSRDSIRTVVRRIVLVTVIFEAGAFVVITTAFALDAGGLSGDVVWRGIFTAVSAFNNAGFDLEGGGRSLTGYAGNPLVLWTVALVATMGATGYAIWWDVKTARRWAKFALNTKLVLGTSGVLIAVGALEIFAREGFRSGTLGSLSWPAAFLAAGAESIYARTSGFTAFALGDKEPETLLVLMGLMFIGGASGSTAGGIKLTTFSALWFAIVASVRGDEHVHAFGREIPWRHINRALSVALLSVAIVFGSTFMLAVAHDGEFIDIMFEVVSAFATCGLSTGITGSLNDAGRLIIIVTMFVGRIGPLTIALALAERLGRPTRLRYPESELNIG
jgi:trk system potassium uptake protein